MSYTDSIVVIMLTSRIEAVGRRRLLEEEQGLRHETITKWLDPEAAALSRDALAKIVYSRLFDWLVDKINNSIGQDPESKSLIGVLVIYGFESFKANRFVTGTPFVV
ncbi:unnamed protein product [Sphenostylis stenocarpa]|uniref:Myosin motor domain-containing protein n=1 Tax=Sphenostylis stenocarpa TaxID=92480 RepID=A0AA86W5D8_9FABA|nr:unnamed protein product [Sphenostylis stenocarpa]